jgi:predicted amino acid dehydrogenase
LDTVTPEQKADLLAQGVQKIISFTPDFVDPELGLGFTQIEACLLALKAENTPLTWNEILKWIQKTEAKPTIISIPEAKSKAQKFAFLVHPLSMKHLSHPLGIKNARLLKGAEKLTPHVPGFFYGKIKGIRSESNGMEVEGLLYLTLETPKMLLKAKPEAFYRKAVQVAKLARSRGAGLMGLGAYTKIVGDGGVTISKRSAIPVTTGNSLSSAATLWAANMGVKEMGFIQEKKGILQGTAVVVGATGSIGKVTAKLLAAKWTRLVLVAPNPQKLLELKEEIEKENAEHPDFKTELVLSTDATDYLPRADLIITTTSNQKGSVIDISKVQAGAVICDVSRPFDITEDQAQSRPDVLFIASGEVELPGKVTLDCDIGLHGSVVYACLAETALLTMEGRLESFSLSRNLDAKKVKEIDQLARKHGVRLAAIMGHTSEITLEEISLCRKIATEIRAENEAMRVMEALEATGSPRKNESKRSQYYDV